MRLRVLLTNGSRTVDLLWLRHTGSDIYYGFVGSGSKHSYHESGARHFKNEDGEIQPYSAHHPLRQLSGQLQLSTFGFHRNIVESEEKSEFVGKKSDAVLYLDSRTLPEQPNVMFGLLEPGNYGAILPVHATGSFLHISIITAVTPWIYTMVCDPLSDDFRKFIAAHSD
jgi:hypothetical protein